MAVYSRGRTKTISPERTKIWVEPNPKPEQKVSIVYYLSRNGQFEHPHYIKVPLSISHGLYLSVSLINVYKIYKAVRGADASTQTCDNRTQQRLNGNEVEDHNRNDITELSGEEVNLVGSADIRDGWE
ncbi:hypothetical protein Ddye_018424 [Dipteronia dyeriana]|uniref:SOSEKI DIX-like domain-containing protein n=1 Tax=Dipteronia dyeriana TaxID=168575 RepID=A0AAD9UBE6_9ROSI|nr:hypothetical protein Ddye_018424 [Dipteronia dyeriana]